MDEKRASAKAIAVGSLIAFLSACIVSCIFFAIAVFMAVGPQIEDWEALENPEYVEKIFEDMEPLDALNIVIMAVIMAVVWGGFALLGGYTAGRMGKEEPVLNGTWVGGIVGGILLLFVLLQFLLTLGAGDFLQALLNLFIGSVLTAAIFFLAMLGGRLAAGGGEEGA